MLTPGGPVQTGAPSATAHQFDVQPSSLDPEVMADRTYPIWGDVTTTTAHTLTEYDYDDIGNLVESRDYGRTQGDTGTTTDQLIISHQDWAVRADDVTQWNWRPQNTRHTTFGGGDTSGNRGAKVGEDRVRTFGYNAFGDALTTTDVWTGIGTIDRFHEDPTKAIAPKLSQGTEGVSVTALSNTFDVYGNIRWARLPRFRCSSVEYDALNLRPASSTTYGGLSLDPATSCGVTKLTTVYRYDAAFGLPVETTSPTGARTSTAYDGFGRPTTIYNADPDVPLVTGAHPAIIIDYGDPWSRRVHTSVLEDATGSYRESWVYLDALGRPVVRLRQADRDAGDGGGWIASGRVAAPFMGIGNTQVYEPFPYDGDPAAFPLTQTPASPSWTIGSDARGRTVIINAPDGRIVSSTAYHALSEDTTDRHSSGLPVTTRRDGHGRVAQTIVRARTPAPNGALDEIVTSVDHLGTGEVSQVTRSHSLNPDEVYVRWMKYDSLGHVTLNAEPNTARNFMLSGTNASMMKAWRYAYRYDGLLMSTSDARGCGENFFYDNAGRLIGEDFSPCTNAQAPYSAPNFQNGDGLERLYTYDAPEPGQTQDYGTNAAFLLGQVSAIADRGAHTRFAYDARGRNVGVARALAKPGVASATMASRYTSYWFRRATTFDEMDRVKSSTTGADLDELLGADHASTLTVAYSHRGLVRAVDGSYGALIQNAKYDVRGALLERTWGDAAQTKESYHYDDLFHWMDHATIARQPASIWSGAPGYSVSASSGTLQTILEDVTIARDPVGNPLQLTDGRIAGEWPDGAKPVSQTMSYDDLDRLSTVDSTYAGGDDKQVPTILGSDSGEPLPPLSAPAKRVRSQSFTNDWQGNLVASHDGDDENHAFYDRSLGTVSYAGQRLVGATDGTHSLSADYDAAGNLVRLTRSGVDELRYDWDEVGELARAQRFVGTTRSAELTYAYDAGGNRVLRHETDGSTTADVFNSLRLTRAGYDGASNTYDRLPSTETAYLVIGGASLGRVLYGDDSLPHADSSSGNMHVFLEPPDLLGSAAIVIDKASGELVERMMYQPYGADESDYRPDRWENFREDARFTGKEADREVGVMYFGQRYYSAALGRWLSADPLTIHGLGADLNAYAYVGGRVTTSVDPNGLEADALGGTLKKRISYADGSTFYAFGQGDVIYADRPVVSPSQPLQPPQPPAPAPPPTPPATVAQEEPGKEKSDDSWRIGDFFRSLNNFEEGVRANARARAAQPIREPIPMGSGSFLDQLKDVDYQLNAHFEHALYRMIGGREPGPCGIVIMEAGLTPPIVAAEEAEVEVLVEELVPSLRPRRDPGSTPHPFEGIPKALHPQIFDIIADLQAARAGDAAAVQRLAGRSPHTLTGDLAGWESLDIAGRENPLRFLYKQTKDGIRWMVRNTH